MKDLIRSPLQFVQPMTNEEWQELVLRADHRERQRIKRHEPHANTQSPELTDPRRGGELTRPASSASL